MTVYRQHIMDGLAQLAAPEEQQRTAWLKGTHPASFIKAAEAVVDDSGLFDALEAGSPVFSTDVDQQLRRVCDAILNVNDWQPVESLVSSPEMQLVRQSATRALEMIAQLGPRPASGSPD